MLADWSAVIRTEWDTYIGGNPLAVQLDHLSFSHGHLLSSLRADPKAAEFEDFAIVGDIVESQPPDDDDTHSSPPESQFQIDLFRSYTEQGLRVWRHSDDAVSGVGGARDGATRGSTPHHR